MEATKEAACDGVDKAATKLNDISQEIWSNPEENFNEHHAHTAITAFLEGEGLKVERNFVLSTGFRCVLGSEQAGPNVAILCEYDALPEIGHACGHNLIAEAGLAAVIGVKTAFDKAGKPLGKLTVIGTPAEEGGGGKIDMLNAGVFDDVDVAMMTHPAPYTIDAVDMLAIEPVTVIYHGKAAHASAFPWNGVNALDAAVLCYQNVSVMRQQLQPSWRVHGVIKNGGAKPNIIPELTELEFYARAPTKKELESLKEKMTNCFLAAATATGCNVDVAWNGRPYLDIVHISSLDAAYKRNAEAVGVDFVNHAPEDLTNIPTGSTDMGNVSYVVPSIHPMFYIGTDAANHTRPFAAAAGAAEAQPFTLKQGKAMALTVLELFENPDLVKSAKQEFNEKIQNRK